MKKSYACENGKAIQTKRLGKTGISIIPDIKPYRSMITGEMITSRSKHREHLKQHGCIEVGNEAAQHFHAYDNLHEPLREKRHDVIRSQFADMSHRDFKQLIENSVKKARGY